MIDALVPLDILLHFKHFVKIFFIRKTPNYGGGNKSSRLEGISKKL